MTTARPAWTPRLRIERLMALGRVGLAAFTWLAIWLDPPQLAVLHLSTARSFLFGYGVWAVAVALGLWRPHRLYLQLAVLAHAVDVVGFSLLAYFTQGAATAFLLGWAYVLGAAALRWRWRGVVWTAMAAILTHYVAGMAFAPELLPERLQATRVIGRSVYVLLLAGFFGYLSAQEPRLRRDLALLSGWPAPLEPDEAAVLRDALTRAAEALRTSELWLVWEDGEEPWVDVARHSGGAVETRRDAPQDWPALLQPDFVESDVLVPDLAKPKAHVLSPGGRWPARVGAAVTTAGFADRFRAGSLLSARVVGEQLSGRLYALDVARPLPDDLLLARVVAQRLGAALAHVHLVRTQRYATLLEERERLAHELHDGVLQALAGQALKLQAVEQLVHVDAARAAEQLGAIRKDLTAELRDLRAHVMDSEPPPPGDGGAPDLVSRLADLARRVEAAWDLKVRVKVDLPSSVPQRLTNGIYRLAREGLVNAARHGEATEAELAVRADQTAVHVRLHDNGRSFRFHGTYDHAALVAQRLGPIGLKEHVIELGGTLAIRSAEDGATLEIRLPLAGSGS